MHGGGCWVVWTLYIPFSMHDYSFMYVFMNTYVCIYVCNESMGRGRQKVALDATNNSSSFGHVVLL